MEWFKRNVKPTRRNFSLVIRMFRSTGLLNLLFFNIIFFIPWIVCYRTVIEHSTLKNKTETKLLFLNISSNWTEYSQKSELNSTQCVINIKSGCAATYLTHRRFSVCQCHVLASLRFQQLVLMTIKYVGWVCQASILASINSHKAAFPYPFSIALPLFAMLDRLHIETL